MSEREMDKKELFEFINKNYHSTLDVRKVPEAFDMIVTASIPLPGEEEVEEDGEEEETQPPVTDKPRRGGRKKGIPSTRYTIDLANFFLKYPELTWTNVTFLEPLKKGDEQMLIDVPIAMFGVDRKTAIEIPRHKKTQHVQLIKSRPHVIQLFYMFRKAERLPTEPGKKAEIIIKLTQAVKGDDKEYKKLWKMSLFTPVSDSDQKRKPPPTRTGKANDATKKGNKK